MSVKSSGGGLYLEAGVDIDKLKRDLQNGADEVDKFTNKVKGEGKKLGDAFNESSKGAKLFNAGLGEINSNLGMLVGTAAGVGLVTVLTRQLMGLAQRAKEFSSDFEVAMKEVQTISIATRENFDEISDAIVNMSASSRDGAVALAKAYYEIVSSGYDGAEALELLRVASQGATAGTTETLIAADGLTTVLNAWQKSASEVQQITDVMFRTVDLGKVSFEEIAQSIAQVAPIAASMKIPFEDVMGLIATITKQGTPAAMAITQIRSALVGLAKEYGSSVFEGRSVIETFEEIAEASDYSVDKLIEVVGRIEGANAILATTGEKFGMASEDLRAVSESAGATEKAYAKMMEAAENKWILVHNRWNRELKSFGDYLLRASGGLADFLNRMLEDREADVVAPKVQSQLKELENQLAGITDKEERLKLVQDRMIAIREEQKKLAEQERDLEKKQPGAIRKGIEAFNAGIGLGTAFTPGRVNQVELEIIQEDIEINRRVEQGMKDLYRQVLSAEDTVDSQGGGGLKGQARTLAVMSQELKDLQDRLGTGTAVQDVAIIRQMSALNDEIERYHLSVRKELGSEDHSKILESGKAIVKNAKLETDGKKEALKATKQLSAEEEERLRIQAEALDILNKQAELIDDISNGFKDSSEILGALSFAIGEIDRDLGEIVGRIADVAHNASNLFAAIGAKDPVTAIASGIGVLGSIFGIFNSQKTDQVNAGLESINRTLERQSAILSKISGENWFELATKQISDYEKAVNQAAKALEGMYLPPEIMEIVRQNAGRPGSNYLVEQLMKQYGVNTAGWSIDDYVKAIADGAIELNDVASKIFQDALNDREAMIQLMSETYERTLGFTSTNVADAIFTGIEEGLYNSEASLSGFAENFGSLLRTTFRKNMITALNDQFLLTFMERFNASMKDGTLDDTERGELEKLYVNAVNQAKQMWDDIAPILQDYTGEDRTDVGISGAIRAMSEETGTFIGGQFYAMREIQQRTFLLINEQLDIANLTLSHLAAIEVNTSYNRHLVQLRDDIYEMKNVIKERL